MESARVKTFPCKNCASQLEFSPGQQELKCPNCGHIDQIPRSREEIREFSFNEYLGRPKKEGLGIEARQVRCQACGASFQLESTVISTECGYCGCNVLVSEEAMARDRVTPEAVVPFRITPQQAQAAVQQWVASLWFAPGTLKAYSELEKLQGIYRPYFTYDAQTANYYEGERGDYYWTTETYTTRDARGRTVTRTRQVRKIRWTFCSGHFNRFFDDILVKAGRELEFETGFELAGLEPFDPKFLSGWKAETYSVQPEQGWQQAKSVIQARLIEDARKRVGGDQQRGVSVETAFSQICFKHLLLPLYVGVLNYRDQNYPIQVNGQSGEVHGKRPYSAFKIAIAILIPLAVLGLLLLMR
ncbi:MAG: hypothetical protein HYU36_00590 [Planctomycetes bacterium]|nr:hypothetical protein [Planctomycetota bacterium]